MTNEQTRKSIDNLEYFNDTTIWTYDNGSSEHITNNKNIFKNYKNTETIMKCANNTKCKFEGYSTYYGSINGFKIILHKVLFSKNIKKSIISGIKLTKKGLNTIINSDNDKIYVTFKTKNNELIDDCREYKNKKVIYYYQNIKNIFSTPYNPQINGLAERFNQTIISCTRSLLFTANINTKFWDFTLKYIFQKSRFLAVWYITTAKNENIKKFEPRPKKGIFLLITSSTSFIVKRNYISFICL
ncbi:hypothetical protein PIROE2DRAFT_11557 [Piromyces sp. E2]|nr:hypothetical protein PIROE2DRAFT_11557 [Piromyces sp. E2]|eukprot:OUM62238.1 hypothetical protein PIROE2DRAFT_11557 [Piromyces sp. E2]